uniref:SFRICE_007992 n=1 Tax=Spodoptera frugiperda TaxID=7108 RepID=A0A2H1WM99_SPOFR
MYQPCDASGVVQQQVQQPITAEQRTLLTRRSCGHGITPGCADPGSAHCEVVTIDRATQLVNMLSACACAVRSCSLSEKCSPGEQYKCGVSQVPGIARSGVMCA